MDISLKRFKPVILLLMVLGLFALTVACGDAKEIIKEKIVEKVVEVEKIVPGPTQIVEKIVPGPTQIVEKIVEKIVPGPTQIVEKIVQVAPPEKEKREIVFGGLDWDSALVQNGVARYIVEHGYGYPTSQIEGSTLPLFQGLRKGDVDITMEIWLPNQDAAWNEAVKAGEVIPVGKSLEDNWQSTFLIPGYLQDANPELDSIEDLKNDEFNSLFEQDGGKAVLLGCIAGWGCRTMQDGSPDTGVGQIVGMGLEDHVVLRDPGTSGALAAAIEGAFAKEDAILFYYWGPTALAHKLDMRDLEQPDPSECADNSPVHGCAFPAAEIMIAMNIELVADAPELIPFFKNWDWSAGNQLAAEGWYSENKTALKDAGRSSEEIYSATGVWYLKNNDGWKDWVPADVLANVEAALANES
jgi:glycine betaine/proline transport system substrate-binding protein